MMVSKSVYEVNFTQVALLLFSRLNLLYYLPAKQTKLHVLSIPLEWNGEYMKLGLFSRQTGYRFDKIMMKLHLLFKHGYL